MSVEAFGKALAAFQADIPHLGKDQTAQTGSYSYAYADLTTISTKALPLLAAQGLSFSSRPTMTADFGFVLAYSLVHEGGHWESGFYPLPDPAKSTAQQIGSAITYARRYSLCAVTGIAPGGEDDDGREAVKATPAQGKPAKSDPLAEARNAVWRARLTGWEVSDIEEDYAREHGGQLFSDATVDDLTAYRKVLEAGRK